jgi:hypothetical protein
VLQFLDLDTTLPAGFGRSIGCKIGDAAFRSGDDPRRVEALKLRPPAETTAAGQRVANGLFSKFFVDFDLSGG